MQAQEAQKAAVCSLQACITTAVQAGRAGTAGAAAEQMAACLGRSDAQGAAEAILMAQSAHTVGDMEALFQDAAAPQVEPGQHFDVHCTCAYLGFAFLVVPALF